MATLSYRLGKVLRDTPDSFGEFQIHDSVRKPAQILAHINDLMDWALTQIEGKARWRDSAMQPWPGEVARFYRAMQTLDERIAAGAAPGVDGDRLFQGAIADALTHTGQLAMLRHIAGIPIRGESYYAAEIVAGRVGSEQAAARKEFD